MSPTFVPLPSTVVQHALQQMPDDVRRVLLHHGPRAIIAGGFLRSIGSQVIESRHPAEPAPKDLDLFLPEDDNALGTPRGLRPLEGRKATCTSHALTYARREPSDLPVQVIRRFPFSTAEDLLRQFDFTVAQAAFWWTGTEWTGICHAEWASDLAHRSLDIQSEAPNPLGTLLRLQRYHHLGYTSHPTSVVFLALRVAEQVNQAHAKLPPHDQHPNFFPFLVHNLIQDEISPTCLWGDFEYEDLSQGEAHDRTPPPVLPFHTPTSSDPPMGIRPQGHWTASALRRVLEIPESPQRDHLIERLNSSSLSPGWEYFGPITEGEVEAAHQSVQNLYPGTP